MEPLSHRVNSFKGHAAPHECHTTSSLTDKVKLHHGISLRLRPYHTVRRICPLCPHPLCLPALPRLQDPIGHEEHTRGYYLQLHVHLPPSPPFSCKTCDGSACKSKSCTRSPCSSLRARSSGVRSSLPLIPAGIRQC